jgi:hypothetical protein
MVRLHYVRFCTLSEVWDYWRSKADGVAQYIINGRGARVALRAHTTHTHPNGKGI